MAICGRCGAGKLTERPCPRCRSWSNSAEHDDGAHCVQVPSYREPKPIVSTLDMMHEAVRLLKLAGFVLHCPSRKTEACYYKIPGRDSLIRVATHAKNNKTIIASQVVAALTFKGTHLTGPNSMRLHSDKFAKMVHLAIGQYMIKSGERELARRAEGTVNVAALSAIVDGLMKTM